jgi:large subunit ribosomal protein L18
MANLAKVRALRAKRKSRVRKKISGSGERPRLTVYRSAMHMSAQVIDDVKGVTLVAVSSFGKDAPGGRAKKEVCEELGKQLAAKCLEKNVSSVVFDKNGFSYHGRIKALADGARAGGLKF